MSDDIEGFYSERMQFTAESRRRMAVTAPGPSHLRRMADDFLVMIDAYLSDAEHFHDNGDLPRALEAVSYAYGWMDAGARVGLFDVGGDGERFTLTE